MASKSITALKADNNSVITTNGARAITGAILNSLLGDILDSSVNRITDAAILGLNDFDSSQTYPEGRAVIYDDGGGNQLYRANVANGPAAFNPAEWDNISGDTNLGTSDLTVSGNRILNGAGFSLDLGIIGNELGAFKVRTLDGDLNIRSQASSSSNAYSEIDVPYNSTLTLTRQSLITTYSRVLLNTSSSEWSVRAGNNVVTTEKAQGVYTVRGSRTLFSTEYGLALDPITNLSSRLYYFDSYVDITEANGLVISEVNSGLGLSLNDRAIDEANRVWATDDNWIPSVGAIKANVGASITNDYIPVGNATNDGIEDSFLQITGTSSIANLSGIGTEGAKNKITFDNGTNQYARPDYALTVSANGSRLELGNDNDFSSQTFDSASLILPGSLTRRTGLYNLWSNTQGQFDTYFTTFSGVTFMGHKYGPTTDPRWGTDFDSYTWMSTPDQKMQIGYGGPLASHNAHLILTSLSTTPNPRPHYKLTDGYDETGTAPDNNSGWVSSNDNVRYWRDNNGVNIPIKGLKSVISNTQASTATLTPDANSEDLETVTALAVNLTIAAPTGTPVDGQKLVIKIKDDGTSRTLTWDAIFQVIGTTLPTATTISKWHRIELEYNTTDTKWDVVDVKEQV